MGLGAMMAGGNAQEGRIEDDFYATPKEGTQTLFTSLPDHFDPNLEIFEPCCGDGAMVKVIEANGYKVVGSDLVDRGYGSIADFREIETIPQGVVITNPPFVHAEELIRLALGTWKVDQLALLLKSTFFHAGERQALFDEFKPNIILALPWRLDFQGKGRPTMECSWFYWNRKHRTDYCQYEVAVNLNPKKKSKRKVII